MMSDFFFLYSLACWCEFQCFSLTLSSFYGTCCKVCNLLQYYFLDTVSYITHLTHLWKIIQKVKDLRDMASISLTNDDEEHSINHVCGLDEMIRGESKHHISEGKFCVTPYFTPKAKSFLSTFCAQSHNNPMYYLTKVISWC